MKKIKKIYVVRGINLYDNEESEPHYFTSKEKSIKWINDDIKHCCEPNEDNGFKPVWSIEDKMCVKWNVIRMADEYEYRIEEFTKVIDK